MIEIYFDGATHLGNPTNKIGYASYFAGDEYFNCLEQEEKTLTNNVAEYYGFGLSLKLIRDLLDPSIPHNIVIRGDSNLVCNQMNGLWRIKEGPYVKAARICEKELARLKKFHKIKIEWIPRDSKKAKAKGLPIHNEKADELSKKALLINK